MCFTIATCHVQAKLLHETEDEDVQPVPIAFPWQQALCEGNEVSVPNTLDAAGMRTVPLG